jgi:prepilin-type N-terminal cleavage/methylation domain-containing protein
MNPQNVAGQRDARRRAGFTLVEVLIALTVLAVTMTAVFTMFSSGLRLRSVTRDRMSFDRDARLMLTALADDLGHLVPAGPRPLVTEDAIVLWRTPAPPAPGRPAVGEPLLVTYQWSGSAAQDSLLVRMTTPVNVDVADSALVHAEFLKWARDPIGMQTTRLPLFRDEEHARFGRRASLGGLGGSWTGYPGVRDFRFEIVQDITDLQEETVPTELMVRLRARPTAPPAGSSPQVRQDAWTRVQNRGLRTTFRVAGGLAVPVFSTDLQREGAS